MFSPGVEPGLRPSQGRVPSPTLRERRHQTLRVPRPGVEPGLTASNTVVRPPHSRGVGLLLGIERDRPTRPRSRAIDGGPGEPAVWGSLAEAQGFEPCPRVLEARCSPRSTPRRTELRPRNCRAGLMARRALVANARATRKTSVTASETSIKCPAGIEPALPPWQDGRLPLHHGHTCGCELPKTRVSRPPWYAPASAQGLGACARGISRIHGPGHRSAGWFSAGSNAATSHTATHGSGILV